MNCPQCGARAEVIETRGPFGHRRCSNAACGLDFTTCEQIMTQRANPRHPDRDPHPPAVAVGVGSTSLPGLALPPALRRPRAGLRKSRPIDKPRLQDEQIATPKGVQGGRARFSRLFDFLASPHAATHARLDVLTSENVQTAAPQTGRALRGFTRFPSDRRFARHYVVLILISSLLVTNSLDNRLGSVIRC